MDRWDDEWEDHEREQKRGQPGKRRVNPPPPQRDDPGDPEELDGVLHWPPDKRRR